MSNSVYDDFYKNLGQNIKKYREKMQITQQQLADRINKSLNFIGKVEIAFSKPSLRTLIDIADALNTTVSSLTSFKR